MPVYHNYILSHGISPNSEARQYELRVNAKSTPLCCLQWRAERHAFCARMIACEGRASGLQMLIESKIAFWSINRPLPNSRRRFQISEKYHPIASRAARRYHSSRCMNVIASVAAKSNKAIERIVDAGHGSCGASPAPKAHRYPHSADGVVRRPAHRWR